MREKEILPVVKIWTHLEGIVLSEISQRKANTAPSHLCVKSKKADLVKTENRMVVTRDWERGTWGGVF